MEDLVGFRRAEWRENAVGIWKIFLNVADM